MQKLIVISNFKGNGNYADESNNDNNAKFLEKISIMVSKRKNENSLNAIIVGSEAQISPLNMIRGLTCLLMETVRSTLNLRRSRDIKMTNEQIEQLRRRGLCL